MARVILTEDQRAQFLRVLRLFLTSGPKGGPVPWRHGGRGFKGTDCIGMPIYALQLVGVDADTRKDYPQVADGAELMAGLQDRLGPPLKNLRSARAGDIALMRWHVSDGKDLVTHVGVLTELPYPSNSTHPLQKFALLHCLRQGESVSTRSCGVIEHRIDARWASRIVAVYSVGGAA